MNPCLLWAGYNARRTISAKQLEAASNLRPHPNSIGWRLKWDIKSTHTRYINDMILLLDNWHILPLLTCYLWCSSSTCDNERMCYELTYLYICLYILPWKGVVYINRKFSNIKQTNGHHIINEISNSQQLN